MSGIEDVAKSWLVDPAWQRAFKHTLDVLEDYISYVLISLGAICLSVRLLTTLGSGDLTCIIIGVVNATDEGNLLPYATGGTLGMISYAQTEQGCINKIFTPFMEYLPFIMLLQTLVLVIVEKFTFRIPRIAQKVERFYKSVVEESLFGKDPDVAEDMTDPKTSTEAISRRRQRNEICVSLKRSSIIHNVYIAKNVFECCLILLILPINVSQVLEGHQEHAPCSFPINAFPGIVDEPGEVMFQCRGKKLQFFILALWAHNCLMLFHFILSFGCILWCWRFRALTNLIKTIEDVTVDKAIHAVKGHEGKDFLFLFDLLAHSCGLESTLRVLTHSDDNFYKICQPKFNADDHLKVEEDKVKISWHPADIERWLRTGQRLSRSQRAIVIDSYEVTVFPAESVNNTQTIPVVMDDDFDTTNTVGTYSTWFYDLAGGRTEYVITIACLIGKSRMKGEKIVTTLMPYGPEKPRSGMLKTPGTTQIEIFWDPPKGEFTKYNLWIERMQSPIDGEDPSFTRLPSTIQQEPDHEAGSDENSIRLMENLSYKLTTYTILGLEPGERYRIELATKTGNVLSDKSITEIIMTNPLPVVSLDITDVTATSCKIRWLLPDGHSCLRGVQLQVDYIDGKLFKEVAVSKNRTYFNLSGLGSGCTYEVSAVLLCFYNDKRTESEPLTATFTTLPETVKNLKQDSAGTTSVYVKWDAVQHPLGAQNHKLKLSIAGLDFEYFQEVEMTSDKIQYNFSKLPDPTGAGRYFKVSIVQAFLTQADEEVRSAETTEIVSTLPHKPTNMKTTGPWQLSWNRSQTPHVTHYKIKWKMAEDDSSKPTEDIIQPEEEAEVVQYTFSEPLKEGLYKVNVYSVVKSTYGEPLESKELHEKVQVKSNGELSLLDDN